MTEKVTVARPYARAIFATAKQGKSIVLIQQELLLLVELFKNDRVSRLMNSHLTSNEDKISAITNSFGDVLSAHTVSFLSLLSKENRLNLLPEVYRLFVEYRQDHEGIVAVNVISAFKMTKKEQETFDKAIAKRLSQNVESCYSQDENLIAGAIIRTKQLVIDCSLRGQLDKMRSELSVAV